VIIFTSGDSANTSTNKWSAGGWVDPKAHLHTDKVKKKKKVKVKFSPLQALEALRVVRG
jgi:hypothetical protein